MNGEVESAQDFNPWRANSDIFAGLVVPDPLEAQKDPAEHVLEDLCLGDLTIPSRTEHQRDFQLFLDSLKEGLVNAAVANHSDPEVAAKKADKLVAYLADNLTDEQQHTLSNVAKLVPNTNNLTKLIMHSLRFSELLQPSSFADEHEVLARQIHQILSPMLKERAKENRPSIAIDAPDKAMAENPEFSLAI